eukprot:UN02945
MNKPKVRVDIHPEFIHDDSMLVEFITKLDKPRMEKREKYGKLRAAANKGNKVVGHYKRIDRRKKNAAQISR